MTSRGFRKAWKKQKAAYRNSVGGRRTVERKKLVNLVAEELKREVGR
jgi:hypothetical protein